MSNYHIAGYPCPLLLEIEERSQLVVWGDDLSIGPVPGGLSFEELESRRHAFSEEVGAKVTGPVNPQMREMIERRLAQRRYWLHPKDTLGLFSSQDKVFLWFGEGQGSLLALVQAIDTIPSRAEIWFVPLTINAATQNHDVIAAWREKRVLSREELSVAKNIWALFRKNNPFEFHHYVDELPEIFQGMRRSALTLRRLFPSAENGLDWVQWRVLTAIRGQLCTGASAVLEAMSGSYMGDGYISYVLIREIQQESPLVAVEAPPESITMQAIASKGLRLTPLGEAVLDHKADAVVLNGIDKWVGGCHIDSSAGTGYRWSEAECLFLQL